MENPKADLQALVTVGREDNFVAAFVLPLTEIGQGKGAAGHTVNLSVDLCTSPLTAPVVALGRVTEVGVACKAAGVACLRVGEDPLAPSRGVPRGLQQGRLTLAKEQN